MTRVIFIRIFSVLLCGFLFVFIMLCNPVEVLEYQQEKRVLRIPAEIRQKNVDTKARFAVIAEETSDDFVSDYSTTSSELYCEDSSDIIPPDFDIAEVYSRIVYPVMMRKKKIEASFTVGIYVFSDGSIDLVFPSGVRQEFENAVRMAFKDVSVKPATQNSKPVDVYLSLPVVFELK